MHEPVLKHSFFLFWKKVKMLENRRVTQSKCCPWHPTWHPQLPEETSLLSMTYGTMPVDIHKYLRAEHGDIFGSNKESLPVKDLVRIKVIANKLDMVGGFSHKEAEITVRER